MESPYGRPAACDLIGLELDQHASERRQDAINGEFRCGLSLEMRIYNALKRAGYLAGQAESPVHCPWDCSGCHQFDGVCEDEDGNPIGEWLE